MFNITLVTFENQFHSIRWMNFYNLTLDLRHSWFLRLFGKKVELEKSIDCSFLIQIFWHLSGIFMSSLDADQSNQRESLNFLTPGVHKGGVLK